MGAPPPCRWPRLAARSHIMHPAAHHPSPLPPPLPCPQDTTDATRLEFLPHHFLLCSVGASGVVRWQDTSTGRVVAALRTKQVGVGCGTAGSRACQLAACRTKVHNPRGRQQAVVSVLRIAGNE